MPNSKLENKSFKVPFKVINIIKRELNSSNTDDKQAKGIKRATDIINNGKISYQQMKGLKNYFDSYKGDATDDEYKVIGGKVTSKWVDGELGQSRESIKKLKKAEMEGGKENAFLKTHEKDNANANPTNPYGGMIDVTKGSMMDKVMSGDEVYKSSSQKNESYNKEIETIKYLIEYMNK